MTKTIRHILVDQDLSIAELARRIDKSRTWTSLVINGHMKSPGTRKAIAHELGKRVDELWENNGKRAA